MQTKSIAILLTILSLASGSSLLAQPRHELIRGDLPPGMAAHLYQVSDRSLVGQIQPVQIVAPGDTVIEVGDLNGKFFGAKPEKMSVAMPLGSVVRFKLSNLPEPNATKKQLYPSIEILGKLNPPLGLENDFPVQVVVTRSDIQLALNGQMVTRVIYLEDPHGPLPHRHHPAVQPSFDVRSGQDPLRAAEKLGRPMAILRIGSRVPLPSDLKHEFNFGIALPKILPNPGEQEFPEPTFAPAQGESDAQVDADEPASTVAKFSQPTSAPAGTIAAFELPIEDFGQVRQASAEQVIEHQTQGETNDSDAEVQATDQSLPDAPLPYPAPAITEVQWEASQASIEAKLQKAGIKVQPIAN